MGDGSWVLSSWRDRARVVLGHRESADFDWFGPDPISDPAALVGEIENVTETVFDLADMIELFRAKYPDGSVAHLLRALVYFDDAEEDPMPRMFTRTRWGTIKRDIARAVDQYASGE